MRRLRENLSLRLTPGEREEIEVAAMICGVTPSHFVRKSASLLAKKAIEEHKEKINGKF